MYPFKTLVLETSGINLLRAFKTFLRTSLSLMLSAVEVSLISCFTTEEGLVFAATPNVIKNVARSFRLVHEPVPSRIVVILITVV